MCNILMNPIYRVSYLDNGKLVQFDRDTVMRGFFLYSSLSKERKSNLKLLEISNSGIVQLRPIELTKSNIENETRKITIKDNPKKPSSLFELMFGITKEEYNECLRNWSRLTGEELEQL